MASFKEQSPFIRVFKDPVNGEFIGVKKPLPLPSRQVTVGSKSYTSYDADSLLKYLERQRETTKEKPPAPFDPTLFGRLRRRYKRKSLTDDLASGL